MEWDRRGLKGVGRVPKIANSQEAIEEEAKTPPTSARPLISRTDQFCCAVWCTFFPWQSRRCRRPNQGSHPHLRFAQLLKHDTVFLIFVMLTVAITVSLQCTVHPTSQQFSAEGTNREMIDRWKCCLGKAGSVISSSALYQNRMHVLV